MKTMLRDINPRQDWNDRIKTIVSGAKKLKKLRALAAFNVVTDYVAHLDVARLSSELAKLPEEKRKKVLEKSHDEARHVEHPADVMAALLHGLRTGKASRVVASAEALKWLHDVFGEPKEKRIGGQAALMAIQLRELGSKSHLYPAWLSVEQAQLLPDELIIPVADKKTLKFVKPTRASRPEDPTPISWIFEFKRNDTVTVEGEILLCPRDNRVIVAYPVSFTPAFKQDFEPALSRLGKEADVAFLAGFHVLKSKTYKDVLKTLTRQLLSLKKANKKLRLHYEFVPQEEDEIEKAVLLALGKCVDSLGLNEVELMDVLEHLGFKKEAKDIEKNESAGTLYQGARKVLEKLNVRRVHVHCIGYGLILLQKTEDPEKARDGALFGSVAASLKSRHGKLDEKVLKNQVDLAISEAGYNQLGIFESTVWDVFEKRKKRPISALLRKKFMCSGIFEEKDHFAVIVPAPVAQVVKTTVGLGDVVSACALAYEVA